MTKQEQFLWIVQTCLLANATNVSIGSHADRFRHDISATGMFGNIDEAVRASEFIPHDMDASSVAHEFVFFICSNRREGDDAGSPARCADWMIRT
ncbi:hypothetical protein NRB_00590 [Novosphingobium sp. 11B]